MAPKAFIVRKGLIGAPLEEGSGTSKQSAQQQSGRWTHRASCPC